MKGPYCPKNSAQAGRSRQAATHWTSPGSAEPALPGAIVQLLSSTGKTPANLQTCADSFGRNQGHPYS
jgi:hypothetical protein